MTAEERDALAKKVFGDSARFVVSRTGSGAYRASVRNCVEWLSRPIVMPSTVFESPSQQEAIDAAEQALVAIAASKAADDAWSSVLVAAEERDFDALVAAVERLRATKR